MEPVMAILLSLPGYWGSHEAVKILVKILRAILKVEMLGCISECEKMVQHWQYHPPLPQSTLPHAMICYYYDFLLFLNVYECTFYPYLGRSVLDEI